MIIAEFTLTASVEDFIAFGGVCKSWRGVGRADEFVKSNKLSWPRVPFLMLPEKEGCKERELYSLYRRKIFTRLPLPEAEGNRCIESRFGWLLALACSPENEGDVQLLNPFSGARILLPNYKTLPSFIQYKHNPYRWNPWFDFITRSVLSANPSHTSHFVVLLVLCSKSMAFWRNGDNHWTIINSYCGSFLDVNYSDRDQSFYAISTRGDICVWNYAAAADPTPLLKLIYTIDREVIRLFRWGAYLLESSAGELLLVARNGVQVEDKGFNKVKLKYGATEFRVYHVDATRGECKRIWSLKDDAIFVGHNAAISIKVQPGDDAIKSNHIYFSDDSIFAYGKWSSYPDPIEYFSSDSESSDDEGIVFSDDYICAYSKRTSDNKSSDEEEEENGEEGIIYSNGWGVGNLDARDGGGKDMGIYNLEDGSIQRFDHPDVETLSFFCPSLWIAPSSFSWRLR